MENKTKGKSRFRRWLSRLRIRYRFVVVDDATFDEKWSVRLSPLFFILFFGLGAIVIVLVTTFIIAWTPLREYIPGYPDGTERQSVIENKVKLDALEAKLNEQAFYIERVKTIINGGVIPDSSRAADSLVMPLNPAELKKAGKEEKAFRKKVENKERRYAAVRDPAEDANSGGPTYFYIPANGVISQSFNPKKNHNGVDISTARDEPVKATLDGTVVFAGYTTEGGYEIHLQHSSDIVTLYKHNSYLFASTGQHVRAGEIIALSGNTGEQSNGNHVHFEIWDNGMAVDPEEYVGF
ncbi:MAG TPA: M23 family metallopeptidase [Flavobacteriales bacterium]|nr:M23 family metallopeptidase [Flavobacteriales bacterium]